MTKETIEKIISNNRRPFAVHQLFAEFERLERETAKLKKRYSILADAMSEVKATDEGKSTQSIKTIVNGCIKELRGVG